MPFNLIRLMQQMGPIALFFLPWILIAITLGVSPHYWAPAFSDPICAWALVGMFIWDVIGLVLSMISPSGIVKFVCFLFFTLPLCIAATLVPAVVTILRALGPIMNKGQ
jgi:hypothetical protein